MKLKTNRATNIFREVAGMETLDKIHPPIINLNSRGLLSSTDCHLTMILVGMVKCNKFKSTTIMVTVCKRGWLREIDS